MSDFEFMRNVTIGQYLPIDSPITRLDPRTRILMFTIFLLSLTFTTSIVGLLIGIALILIGLRLAKISLGYTLRGLLVLLPFLTILAIIQLFLTPTTPESNLLWQLGPLKIFNTGIWTAITLLLRFAALYLILSMASFCLSTTEIIHGLEKLLQPFTRLKLPAHDLVMIIQIMLRFIPILAQTAERIAKSQASRGAEWGTKQGNLFKRVKQFIPLLVPLFITSLRKTETLAMAMDARGYGLKNNRTSMVELHFTQKDTVVLIFIIVISVVILFLL